MNTVEFTPKEILVSSIVDGMNRYMSQVLLPAGLVASDAWQSTDTGTGSEVCTRKYAIAEEIATRWEQALQARIHRPAA